VDWCAESNATARRVLPLDGPARHYGHLSTFAHLTMMIELKAASKIFPGPAGGFPALDAIDLALPAGEFVAVVGKSGSGKSTLLHLIAGIDRPSRGEIVVDGAALNRLDESQLSAWRGRHVGVVFQSFQLLPTLSVLENVLLPMDFCRTLKGSAARERALELLDRVGVADQAQKLPAQLSGGQQQRAAIARALANDPPLVVADEPTGNLDSQSAHGVIALLAELVEQGRTVLMVTHETDFAASADRVIELADGRVARETHRPKAASLREVAHA